MAFIGSSDLSVDTRATDIGVLYHAKNAYWKQIFRNKALRSPTKTAGYPVFDVKGQAFRDFDKIKKVGKSKAPRIEFEYTWNEFTIQPYHDSTFIEEDEINEANAIGIDEVTDRTNGIQDILNLKMNKDLQTLMVTTANWSNNNSVTAVWTDKTNGDPELDVRKGNRIIQTASNGLFRANTMVLSQRAFDEMMTCTKILNKFQYNLSDMKGAVDAIKSFFEIDQIFVVPTAENTAKMGQSKSMSDIWSTSAWIGYIEPMPARNKPSAIYPVSLAGKEGNEFGLRISTVKKLNGDMFDDTTSGVLVKAEVYTEFVVAAPDLGYVLTGIYT